MVMHARKFPRLTDGYHDRGQTQSYEEKNASKFRYTDRYNDKNRDSPGYRYSDNSRREDSTSGRTGTSPPRYQNKSSYIERNKDKVDKAGSNFPKRPAHDRQHRGNKDGRNREHHRAEVRKSAVRVCGDWSEHVSSIGKVYYYNFKTEQSRWEKPKEWIDEEGTDDKASSSKYKEKRPVQPTKGFTDRQKHSTSATATSTSANAPLNSRPSSSHGRSFSFDSSSHSKPGASSQDYQQHSKQLQSHTVPGSNSNSSNKNSLSSGNSSAHKSQSNAWHSSDKRDLPSGIPSVQEDRTFVTPERPRKGYDLHGHKNSGDSAPLSRHSISSRSSSLSQKSDYNGTKLPRNDCEGHFSEDSQQAEDMDISPGSTPTDGVLERPGSGSGGQASTSRPSSTTASLLSVLSSLQAAGSDVPLLASLTSQATSPGGGSPGSLLPQLLQQLRPSAPTAPSTAPSSQQVLQQSIQVLQKLQQNMLMQQKQQQQRQLQQLLVTQLQQLQAQLQKQQVQQQRQPATSHSTANDKQNEGSQSPYSPPDESDGTPLQSPEYNSHEPRTSHPHPSHTEHRPTQESPQSDRSLKSSRRGSPTPSHTSSQNMSSVGGSQLSATHRKLDSAQLTPSLANYYNEKSIEHIRGLLYDPYEREADIVGDESHTYGSILGTQVSVELKGARSLVRVSELLYTLHEQRILFIRQQIKDLDNWRTQNTFMPSSSSAQMKGGGGGDT